MHSYRSIRIAARSCSRNGYAHPQVIPIRLFLSVRDFGRKNKTPR